MERIQPEVHRVESLWFLFRRGGEYTHDDTWRTAATFYLDCDDIHEGHGLPPPPFRKMDVLRIYFTWFHMVCLRAASSLNSDPGNYSDVP